MHSFLHITNGDGAANILKQSTLEGDTLPWRDTMHYGPFPDKLNLDDVSLVRAAYFGGDTKEGQLETKVDFTLRNEHLRASTRYQEVILWFEHDLLDQLQILQLLDWFGHSKEQPNQLSLICIDQFDGIEPFRGIGQLNPEQMASLFESRTPISEEQIILAQQGWSAFRSPNPQKLEAFINTKHIELLPFLKKSLTRHLEEYPHISDGLTRTERQILTLIAQGHENPGYVFKENMAHETALFIGDWASYRIIGELCRCTQPLICCESGNAFMHPPEMNISRNEFIQQRLKLTPVGEQVLNGELNATAIIHRDHWLGGVHIHSNKSLWMWDALNKQLTLKTA